MERGLKEATKILMYDGTVKKVENIQIGDLIMGDDSTPRKVNQVINGQDILYKISPNDSTKPYYVHGNHIICLRYRMKPFITFYSKGKYPTYSMCYVTVNLVKDDKLKCELSKIKPATKNFCINAQGKETALKN